ncbi:MAG: radical SAM protein [Candidatus Omnitrophota bacterium]
MRFKKIFFIIPNLKGFYGWPSYPHPGIGYVSTYLEAKGVEYDLIDLNIGNNIQAVKRKIKDFKPELIAVTLYTYKHLHTNKLIARIKENFDIPIVVGGPHVSLFKSKVMQESLIDFAVKHEGEKTLWDICRGKHLAEISNLIYRDKNNVRENPSACFITNLDELPFPRYNRFELDRYKGREIGIVSSRGCPYSCIYCPVMTTMGRNFRPRSPQNVVAELVYWHKKGYRNFEFVDDSFLQHNERVNEICDLIEQEKLSDLTLSCSQGIRANKVTRGLLTRMYRVGFRCLGFGIESASEKVLESIKKGQTFRQIDQAVHAACEIGYDVRLFFMLGFPGETIADVEKSFQFALKYPVTSANFYNIIPYPGTELFNRIKENNHFLSIPDVYLNKVITRSQQPVFKTASMSQAERKQALKNGCQVSRIINRRHRRKQYKKLGAIGQILAWFLTTPLLYNQIGKITQYRMGNRLINTLRRRLTVF